MRASFYTLGCKVNQNETAAMEELLRRDGFTIVPSSEVADVYVVNSCTVTSGGEAKSRQWLRRKKRENPTAITVLAGCFPQAFPSNAVLPEADIITGTAGRARLAANIRNFLATGKQVVDILPHTDTEAFEELPADNTNTRTRAFIKVQDGCNRRCAYCIIPTARGRSRSRNEDSILAELKALAQRGYREVVFAGINLPSYGRDTNTNLATLAEKAAQIPHIQRIRLSSLDPDLITADQIASFAANPKLCRQFHLSLQSGCDATLHAMCRPYTTQKYREVVQALRTAMPDLTLTTDVIVGFAGESEADFAASLAFIKETQFLKVHVFPFSARPGTPAASFAAQVPRATKSLRAKLLQEQADLVRAKLIAQQEGCVHEVLLEAQGADGFFTGYTRGYIPVVLKSSNLAQGMLISVRLGAFDGEHCAATLL